MHMQRPFRYLVASALTLALLLAGCGTKTAPVPAKPDTAPTAPQKVDKVDVQLAWLMNSQSAAVASAIQEGIYKRYNLDVTLHAGGPNVDPIQNVVSGNMQIGIANSSGTVILAKSQGVPIKAIGTIYQKHPYSFFYKPESGITKPQDLKGKNIGIQSTGRYLLTAFLKKNGLKESDVKITTVGGDLGPLASGQVDAISAWMVNAGQLNAVPGAKYFLTYDSGLRYYANTFFTTDKMVKENPDILKRFMKGTMEGLAFSMDNQQKAVKAVLASAPNLQESIEAKTLELSIPLFLSDATKANGLGYMDKKVWEDGQQILIDTDQMKNAVIVDELFTNQFITNNTPKR